MGNSNDQNMKEVIEDFYTAFSKLDAENMVKHYHPEVIFNDPAFGTLKGERAKNMWRMLCESQKNKDFKIEFGDISSEGEKGSAKWEAFYTFRQTGRRVHNKIKAEFQFQDGLIIHHKDNFNLHIWAKQAMGFKGLLLGYTSFFKSKLQNKTNQLLDKYIQAQQQ